MTYDVLKWFPPDMKATVVKMAGKSMNVAAWRQPRPQHMNEINWHMSEMMRNVCAIAEGVQLSELLLSKLTEKELWSSFATYLPTNRGRCVEIVVVAQVDVEELNAVQRIALACRRIIVKHTRCADAHDV